MADLKISEMTSASQINNDDNVELSQGNSQNGFASVKATILAIAQKIITGINFTSALETESKTIAGAINEVASGGGSSTFAGLSDVDIDDTTLANGQVPKWNSTTEKWENGNAGGGSGGHDIIDSDGNEMTARSGLQFENAYVSDDSTNDKTVVPIYREMTRQQYSQAQDKTGLIVVTDDKAKVVNADSVYPVETSISEHAYLEGDHLIVDGITYIAIDDIAIGDTLTIGTNIQSETLDTRINNVDSKTAGKVSKTGDTMTGNLLVDRGSSGDSNVLIGGSVSRGVLRLYHTNGKYANIYPYGFTENRNITLPDKAGTIALTSDLNGATSSSVVFTPLSTPIFTAEGINAVQVGKLVLLNIRLKTVSALSAGVERQCGTFSNLISQGYITGSVSRQNNSKPTGGFTIPTSTNRLYIYLTESLAQDDIIMFSFQAFVN